MTDAIVMKLRFSFVCLLFLSSNVEQKEDSLFKRNSLLQTPWFIGAISCIKPVLLNNRLMKINNFRLFNQKILSIIRWFAINFIILQRKEERNTFYIPFPTGISCRKEGFCSGCTLKDEIDDHCSQNLSKILIYRPIQKSGWTISILFFQNKWQKRYGK